MTQPRTTATYEVPLWRGLAVFRFASLAYAVILVASNFRRYDHPVAGWIVVAAFGYLARLAADVQDRLRRAAAQEAATRERERLARAIHDDVLQVITLVKRRAAERGGEAAELGRLAAGQEVALRALITRSDEEARTDGVADLSAALAAFASPTVALSTPAAGVWLPAHTAEEVASAVGAALDNVRTHAAGARAWILVEDEPVTVTVTVRDDGPGIPAGRLESAEAEGRIGVAQSIRGRIADVGGSATITSSAGQGTEVELRVPRASRDAQSPLW